MERIPAAYEENPEIVALVGRVALLFQVMKDRPGATALPRAPDQRAVSVDMVEQGLDAIRTVQIGLVSPSTVNTLEGARSRHPAVMPRLHHEIWYSYRRPGREPTTTNYRFYPTPQAKVLQPRPDGGPVRSLTPTGTPKRWNNVLRLLDEVGKIAQPR